MDKQELVELLTATFVTELDERVQALNQDLMALEKSPALDERAGLIKTLFRSAHSLKGAARSVSIGPIEAACHSLEDILTAVRDGRLPLYPPLFKSLFTTFDAIQDAGGRLRARQPLEGGPLESIIPDLAEIASASPARPSTPTPRPAEPSRPALPTPVAPAPPPAEPPPIQPPAPLPVQPSPAAPRPAVASPPLQGGIGGGPPRTSVKAPAPVAASAAVRVAAEKLDALLAQSGELLVARRRIEARLAAFDELRESVAGWTAEWRGVEQPLRRLIDEDPRAAADGRAQRTQALPRRAALLVATAGDRLRRLERDLDRLGRELADDSRVLNQAGGLVEEEVHRARMLPLADGCRHLERAVRDVAESTGKEVELVLRGGDVEVDRSILEALKDPLLHLVRNSVDHGIEAPAARQAAGKPRTAQIVITAALRGAQVEISVADDGRGFDLDAIRRQAERKEIKVPDAERELLRLVFLPGFSTASIITDVSGRGVGLDVVQSRIEALRGTVDIATTAGAGTTFLLTVPLTLTTIAALLVLAGGQTLAIAGNHVQTLVRFRRDEVRRAAGRDVLLVSGAPLPVVPLAGLLGLDTAASPANPEHAPAVVVASGDSRIAFVVDEVLAEQEIVVKSLPSRIRRVRHVSGVTLLPSGAVALLLNAPRLVQTAMGHVAGAAGALPAAPALSRARPRLLVVEDSLTTRALMKSILESHGYDVVVAVDGQDAWERLQSLEVALVVSDVDMPRMDGFALTEAIRGSQRLAELPVVLVTARAADEDQAHGIRAGADAYLLKSAFDQTSLLQTIGQLL